MKNLIKMAVAYTVAGAGSVIGFMGGAWLWENVLAEKADNLKNRIENKSKEEGL